VTSGLPYRLNVGAALFNREGRIFIGRRADIAPGVPGHWQLPQGGVDEGEDLRAAVMRELEEEVGTANAAILAEHPDWHVYDLPPHLIGQAFGGRYRGQRQRWFALRFLGEDCDINLDAHTHPEFCAWRWAELGELPSLAVYFKRDIYARLAQDFAAFAKPTNTS